MNKIEGCLVRFAIPAARSSCEEGLQLLLRASAVYFRRVAFERPSFYQTQPLKVNSENWDGRSDLSSQFRDVYDMPSENKYYIVKGRRLVVLRKRKQSNSYVVIGFKADDPNKVKDIRKEGKLLEKGE